MKTPLLKIPFRGLRGSSFSFLFLPDIGSAFQQRVQRQVNTLVRDLTRHFKGITQTPTLTCQRMQKRLSSKIVTQQLTVCTGASGDRPNPVRGWRCSGTAEPSDIVL